MCTNNVGVAKRLDLEKISKQVADLVKDLDDEVKVDVSEVKKIQQELERVITEKP
jgi:gas vesicle protein